MRHRPGARREWPAVLPFLLIFAGAFVLYLSILLTSQSHVDGDEGVVGIMARHIITEGERPIFFYGQGYGGGAALEAYLAVIPFTLFGESSVSLKLVAFCMSLATLAVTYVFCLRYCSRGTALAAVAILATATPLVEWHTKMRGGYAGLLLFYSLTLLLYARIAYDHQTRGRYYLALGLLCGLAYYSNALILSLLVTLLVGSMYWRQAFWRWRCIGLFLLGFVVGAAPLVYYELTHDFLNTRFITGLGSGGDRSLAASALKLITAYLPRFFVGRNVDQYVTRVPVQAWVEYLVYAGLLGYVLYTRRGSLRAILAAWIPRKRSADRQDPPKPESLLALSVFAHLASCIVSRDTGSSPRYLLPLFPALAILAGSAIESLWHSGSKALTSIAAAVFVVLIGLGGTTHIAYIRPSTVTDDVLLTDGRVVNLQTTGEAASVLAESLRRRGIYHLRCAYFLQWRIIFESQEAVIASSEGLIPGLSRYPAYDERVQQAERTAFAFHQDSAQLQDFSRTASAAQMNREQVYEYVVYLPSTD